MCATHIFEDIYFLCTMNGVFVVSNVLGLDACYGRTYLNMEMAFGSGTNVVDNFHKNT